jgi:DNA-binding transcriptional ArsR family regulator
MDSFIAISEPNRRKIMEMLAANGEMPASAIYKRFKSSPPAISQHLKVLKEAKLVRVEKRAQQRIYFVNPEPLKQLEKWIQQFTQRLEDQYQRLDALLEHEKIKQQEER